LKEKHDRNGEKIGDWANKKKRLLDQLRGGGHGKGVMSRSLDEKTRNYSQKTAPLIQLHPEGGMNQEGSTNNTDPELGLAININRGVL